MLSSRFYQLNYNCFYIWLTRQITKKNLEETKLSIEVFQLSLRIEMDVLLYLHSSNNREQREPLLHYLTLLCSSNINQTFQTNCSGKNTSVGNAYFFWHNFFWIFFNNKNMFLCPPFYLFWIKILRVNGIFIVVFCNVYFYQLWKHITHGHVRIFWRSYSNTS